MPTYRIHLSEGYEPDEDSWELIRGAIALGNIDELESFGRIPSETLKDALAVAVFTPSGTSMSDLSLIAGIAATHPEHIPPGIAGLLSQSLLWKNVTGFSETVLEPCDRAWTNSIISTIKHHTKPDNLTISEFINALHKHCLEDDSSDLAPWIIEEIQTNTDHDVEQVLASWGKYSTMVEDLPQVSANLILLPRKNGLTISPTTWIGEFDLDGERKATSGSIRKLQYDSKFCLISNDSIRYFEDLLNTASTSETDMQKFFEQNPVFLKLLDYAEIHSQIHLRHQDDTLSIPDFLLIPHQHARPQLLELKGPFEKLAVGKLRRRYLASSVLKARTQLLEYSNWFESSSNRKKAKEMWDCDIYRPELALLMGRTSGFMHIEERRKLESLASDIKIITYDDILERTRLYNEMGMNLAKSKILTNS